MPKDNFRWVAQPPGDNLTGKINQKIREAEESGFELAGKEVIEKSTEGESEDTIILLHFSKPLHNESDNETFVETVDLSVGDIEDEEVHSEAATLAVSEQIAEKTNIVRGHHPNHEIVDMELDETGRTLFLLFEPK